MRLARQGPGRPAGQPVLRRRGTRRGHRHPRRRTARAHLARGTRLPLRGHSATGRHQTNGAVHALPPHDAGPSPFRDHPGEEFIFVHQGEAELILPSRTIQLQAGDSAYFKATVPHKTRSLSKERATLLLLVSDDRDPARTTHLHLP
ncbi:cupin domain-containing protein [Actinomadura yumaensis]|uniref:cupin domain-containing protein n=1 Tax=Actinomadura yumaensis TaxID=111807 RepID=UPI00360FF6DE